MILTLPEVSECRVACRDTHAEATVAVARLMARRYATRSSRCACAVPSPVARRWSIRAAVSPSLLLPFLYSLCARLGFSPHSCLSVTQSAMPPSALLSRRGFVLTDHHLIAPPYKRQCIGQQSSFQNPQLAAAAYLPFHDIDSSIASLPADPATHEDLSNDTSTATGWSSTSQFAFAAFAAPLQTVFSNLAPS